MDWVIGELEELGLQLQDNADYLGQPNYEAVIQRYILAAGRFSLWWD